MQNFIIMTDSSCDLPASLAAEMQLTVLPLTLFIGENAYRNTLDESDISYKEVYTLLRRHVKMKTSAVNQQAFEQAMEVPLQDGKDILYIGFSSALSGTFNAARIAAESLAERYPERKLFCVDSLSASLGQGLLIYHAWKQKCAGKSIEEVRDYVEQTKSHLCHWFTVEDLMFLREGGRIKTTAAVLGTILSIKPVMHTDDEGCLTPVDKVRGRKASLRALMEKARELGTSIANQNVFICHGDCEEDANYLAGLMRELGVREIVTHYIGPVIGAHCGPGTVGLFFLGSHR